MIRECHEILEENCLTVEKEALMNVSGYCIKHRRESLSTLLSINFLYHFLVWEIAEWNIVEYDTVRVESCLTGKLLMGNCRMGYCLAEIGSWWENIIIVICRSWNSLVRYR